MDNTQTQNYWLPRSMNVKRFISWWQTVRQRHARTCILMLLAVVTITSIRYHHRPHNVPPRKVIAWYQLYHGGLRMDARKVDFSKCEYKNCVIQFMDNKLDIKKYFSSAKAVLFQGGRFPRRPPRRSSKNQAYVFVSIESPLHLQMSNYHSNSFWRNQANWTMTYRLDSDIPYRYGSVTEAETPTGKDYTKIYQSKTKMAAWLVSDCKTESNREGFIKKLKRYINVDVYGKCGTLHNCTKEQGPQCLDQIGRDYKFYLSFENSMCKDYMTEKVYSWFNRDIISVVRGARTYKNLLPADTYVHTEDFESMDHLAAFLKELGESEGAYVEYLETKSRYSAQNARQEVQNAYCEICKRVHNTKQYKNTYESLSKWWGNGACLKNPRDML